MGGKRKGRRPRLASRRRLQSRRSDPIVEMGGGVSPSRSLKQIVPLRARVQRQRLLAQIFREAISRSLNGTLCLKRRRRLIIRCSHQIGSSVPANVRWPRSHALTNRELNRAPPKRRRTLNGSPAFSRKRAGVWRSHDECRFGRAGLVHRPRRRYAACMKAGLESLSGSTAVTSIFELVSPARQQWGQWNR